MKSLIKIMCSSLLLISLTLSSCTGADYKTIDQKIEEEGVFADFTDKEYKAMLDYCENCVTELLRIKESSHNMDILEKESDKYMQAAIYVAALSQGEEEGKLNALDSKKLKALNKKLQSIFKQPSGYIDSQYEGNEY